MTEIDDLKTHLLTAVEASAGIDALEAVRVGALGKQGRVTQLLKTLGAMSPEDRQAKGPPIQALREAVTAAVTARKAYLEDVALAAKLASERVDVTLPADMPLAGTIHPVSQVMDELAEIFADLGFAVATGPEIEDDWHNFGALNIPETHPARAMQDTFYLNLPLPSGERVAEPKARSGEGTTEARASRTAPLPDPLPASGEREQKVAPMVLRTHTSPVQIRTMVEVARRNGSVEDGIRIIAPGRVYRSDWDATHTPMFHQIEGLVLGRGITLGHLKWTLETFLKAFFERDDVVLRLRPSYFPFTEPSAEVDVGFTIVKGKRVIGGNEGWMEVLGSGMVHRRVIAACGLDPAVWQGFAFGCGIDRLAMLKYGIDDLRPMFEADLRWLKHYGFSALDVPTLSGGVGA